MVAPKKSGTLGYTAIAGYDTQLDQLKQIRADSMSGSLVSMPLEHSKVHSGDHFFHAEHYSLDSAATRTYILQSPTSGYIHFWFDVSGSAITEVQLFEGTTRTGTTDSVITPQNNNRNFANDCTLLINSASSTDGLDGTEIYASKGGSATQQSRQAHASGHDDEIIFKQNTKYLLRSTSSTAANLVSFLFELYEA